MEQITLSIYSIVSYSWMNKLCNITQVFPCNQCLSLDENHYTKHHIFNVFSRALPLDTLTHFHHNSSTLLLKTNFYFLIHAITALTCARLWKKLNFSWILMHLIFILALNSIRSSSLLCEKSRTRSSSKINSKPYKSVNQPNDTVPCLMILQPFVMYLWFSDYV